MSGKIISVAVKDVAEIKIELEALCFDCITGEISSNKEVRAYIKENVFPKLDDLITNDLSINVSNNFEEFFEKEFLSESEGYIHYKEFSETAWNHQQKRIDELEKVLNILHKSVPPQTHESNCLICQSLKENIDGTVKTNGETEQ